MDRLPDKHCDRGLEGFLEFMLNIIRICITVLTAIYLWEGVIILAILALLYWILKGKMS